MRSSSGIDIGPPRLRASRSASPARSRASASSGGGRGGASARARRARRERGRPRPVLHARARGAARSAASRRRSSTTRTRASSTATSARRPSRRRSTTRDREMLGDAALERAEVLAEQGELRAHEGGLRLGRTRLPGRAPLAASRRARMRSRSSTTTTGTILGVVEQERAYSTVHEGAIYLHLGESYRVLELDLEARTALVEPFSGRLLHAGEEGDDDRDRGRRELSGRRLGLEASFGAGQRHRAGRRLPEALDPGRRAARPRHARSPADHLRDGGRVVPARSPSCSQAWTGCRACSAPCTPPSTR